MVDYSIIVPAYNEEAYLPHTLDAIQNAMNPASLSGEIIVVDNNSGDRTGEIARALGAGVVFEPVNQISRARNAGARAALGRYLVFVDADTLISPDLLNTALHHLESGRIAGGGALVAADRPLDAFARKLLSGWNEISRRLGFAAGSFVFCLRQGFDAVGGFDERVYASEEIWFSIRLNRFARRRGMGFAVIDAFPVVTSARKLDWFSRDRLAKAVLVLALFPLGLFSRRLCSIWYERPGDGTGIDR